MAPILLNGRGLPSSAVGSLASCTLGNLSQEWSPLVDWRVREEKKGEDLEVQGLRLTPLLLPLIAGASMLLWTSPDLSPWPLSSWLFVTEIAELERQFCTWHVWATAGRWLLNCAASLVLLDTMAATAVGLFSYYGWIGGATLEAGVGSMNEIPRVLVQLPMYNERQVYKRIIGATCSLDWPQDKLIVQVLDDSTERDIQEGVKQAVEEWRQKGVDVRYRHREDRSGYKAGNLREGLLEPYAAACEYVAILDADFEPASDWLHRTVTHLEVLTEHSRAVVWQE